VGNRGNVGRPKIGITKTKGQAWYLWGRGKKKLASNTCVEHWERKPRKKEKTLMGKNREANTILNV